MEYPVRLNLTVWQEYIKNTYPIWVYPPVKPICPEEIYETRSLDETALQMLRMEKTGKIDDKKVKNRRIIGDIACGTKKTTL